MSNAKTTSEVRVLPSDKPTSPPILVHPREPGLEYYIDHRGVHLAFLLPTRFGVYLNICLQDDFFVITNVGNQTKDYMVMRVSEKEVGCGRDRWKPVLLPSPGTQIEDIDIFSSHIVW